MCPFSLENIHPNTWKWSKDGQHSQNELKQCNRIHVTLLQIVMNFGVVWHEVISNRGAISMFTVVADFAFQGFSVFCVMVSVFLMSA